MRRMACNGPLLLFLPVSEFNRRIFDVSVESFSSKAISAAEFWVIVL